MDNTPIQLMQRTAAVWTQTAIKNGAKGTIIRGDLNATWTGNEAGGQTVLERFFGKVKIYKVTENWRRQCSGHPRT